VKPVRVGTGSRLAQLEGITSVTPFDGIRRTRTDGAEYWSARDLMPLLGYPRWQDFKAALARATASCQAQGHDPLEHFSGSTLIKSTRGRRTDDVELSRFGAYLTAMNGDPRKPNVAMAQGYFAVKTREAELRTDTPRPITNLEMLAAITTEAVRLEQRTSTLEAQNRVLEAKIETIAGGSGYLTVKAWARLHGRQIPRPRAAEIGKVCARLCRERGLEIGQARDEEYGTINTYPETIIDEVMSQATHGPQS
jgi:DNA-damage-inducible protein D